MDVLKFLSTLPVRGATQTGRPNGMGQTFLSTLPVRGATWRGAPGFRCRGNFYPRSP